MSLLSRWLIVLAVSMAFSGACSCNGDDGGVDDAGVPYGLVSLEIVPADVSLEITLGQKVSQAYTVMGHFSGSKTRDLTSSVTLTFDRSEVATLAGATLTTTGDLGGSGNVRAHLGSISATSSVTVLLHTVYNDPDAMNLPPNPGSIFNGPADAARNPSVVYPVDDVLLPANLRNLEVHFLPGAGNTLFAIGFHSPRLDLEVYTRCTLPLNGGCIYSLDEAVWRFMAGSNRGESVQIRVRGTNDAGTGVGTSGSLDVEFAPDDVSGGVYYWTTFTGNDDDTAIMRYDFASLTQTSASLFIDQTQAGGQCIGCHTLSRDGARMVVASDGSYGANLLLYDVGNRQPLVPFDSTPRSAFSSFNPDASRYVGVYSNEDETGFLSYDLNIFNGATGVHIETIDIGGSESEPTTHPDWSPNGMQIAYVRGLLRDPSGNPDDGSLAFLRRCTMFAITYDPGTSTWGAPVALSTRQASACDYYPAFSPGGDIIIFNRSTCTVGDTAEEGCNMYDDPSATLHVMRPMAGAARIVLTRANAPGPRDTLSVIENSFPKWSPFTFRRRNGGDPGRLHWVTFSSNRNMGLRVPAAGSTWIWMAAIDPDTALAGQDPSYPAFLLPFQDLATDNHTAQWAEQVVIID